MNLAEAARQSPLLAIPGTLEDAILRTLIYSDVFDYPLTVNELHRYLHGISVDRQLLCSALDVLLAEGAVEQHAGYCHLPGRAAVVARRSARQEHAQQLWSQILRSGRLIAALPFVRMIALTGSHAMGNAEQNADLDVMLVTAHGRLWLCRAFVILLARLIRWRGVAICPNLIISERMLAFPVRNIYTAHELVQMIPLAGLEVYRQIRAANLWSAAYLPNAEGPPLMAGNGSLPFPRLRQMTEAALRLPAWNALERWEMHRKIHRFGAQAQGSDEACFSADWCQGHFARHGARTLAIYHHRLEMMGLSLEETAP